jgi:hypothetical protein
VNILRQSSYTPLLYFIIDGCTSKCPKEDYATTYDRGTCIAYKILYVTSKDECHDVGIPPFTVIESNVACDPRNCN